MLSWRGNRKVEEKVFEDSLTHNYEINGGTNESGSE